MFPICTLATESVTETKCATQIFADALLNTANTVNESDYEDIIQQWVVTTFAAPDVLTAVLECPEITAIDETETIKFTPIIYKFPTGREIIINYETQPLVLKQRIQAKQKRALPTSDANPRVGAGTDIWTNTDPAWYGIIVTEHGSMDEFVGPDKNNTISIKYIHDNIDKFYPHGRTCTSRSAIANDNYAINRAVTKTVGLAETSGEKDTNDYYIAGDINLGWIMWAEVGLDLALTIATFGGYTAIAGATKATNASRALKNLMSSMRALHKTDSVRDWVSLTRRATQITEQINKLDKKIQMTIMLQATLIWGGLCGPRLD